MILSWFDPVMPFIIYNIPTFFMKCVLAVVGGLYSIGGAIYQVFLTLAKTTNVFSVAQLKNWTRGLYSILGVIVLFIVAYNILLLVVDPDKNTGETSVINLLQKIVTTFILIAIMPELFLFAGNLCSSIVDSGVITKIVFGDQNENANQGYEVNIRAFSSFIVKEDSNQLVDPNNPTPNIEEETGKIKLLKETKTKNGYKYNTSLELAKCPISSSDCTYAEVLDEAIKTGRISYLFQFASNIAVGDGSDAMEFMFFASLAGGFFLIIILIKFCFDLAVRVIKIAFYQIVAPLCIACRLLPKQKEIFDKWKSVTIKTYTLVFIRILVVSFGFRIISMIQSILDVSLDNSSSTCGGLCSVFVRIFLIFGIFLFMNQIPKLIDELLGTESGLQGTIKDKLSEAGKGMAAIAGTGVAAGVGAARGAKRAHDKTKAAKQKIKETQDALAKETDPNKRKQLQGELNKAKRESSKLTSIPRMLKNTVGGFGGGMIRSIGRQTDGFGTKGFTDAFSKATQGAFESADAQDAAIDKRHGMLENGINLGQLINERRKVRNEYNKIKKEHPNWDHDQIMDRLALERAGREYDEQFNKYKRQNQGEIDTEYAKAVADGKVGTTAADKEAFEKEYIEKHSGLKSKAEYVVEVSAKLKVDLDPDNLSAKIKEALDKTSTASALAKLKIVIDPASSLETLSKIDSVLDSAQKDLDASCDTYIEKFGAKITVDDSVVTSAMSKFSALYEGSEKTKLGESLSSALEGKSAKKIQDFFSGLSTCTTQEQFDFLCDSAGIKPKNASELRGSLSELREIAGGLSGAFKKGVRGFVSDSIMAGKDIAGVGLDCEEALRITSDTSVLNEAWRQSKTTSITKKGEIVTSEDRKKAAEAVKKTISEKVAAAAPAKVTEKMQGALHGDQKK